MIYYHNRLDATIVTWYRGPARRWEACSAGVFGAAASPEDAPWLWTLSFGHHEDRMPTHGYAPTREAAMAAFAKSWRLEGQLARGRGRAASAAT